MQTETFTIEINTNGKTFTDITDDIISRTLQSRITGIVHIFSLHTTSCINILENEVLSLLDIEQHLEELAPSTKQYNHDRIHLRQVPPEERINGVAHVRSLYFNHSLTVPIENGCLVLGEWQSIFLIDLDGPRTRRIHITVMGD